MLKEEIDGMEIKNTDIEEKIESDPGEVYFSMKIVFLKLKLKLKFNHGSHDMIRQGDNAGRFFGGVLFMV